jgi:hypothetical protein
MAVHSIVRLCKHDSAQYWRGNARSIAAVKPRMIQHNQTSGNKVAHFNWRP